MTHSYDSDYSNKDKNILNCEKYVSYISLMVNVVIKQHSNRQDSRATRGSVSHFTLDTLTTLFSRFPVEVVNHMRGLNHVTLFIYLEKDSECDVQSTSIRDCKYI